MRVDVARAILLDKPVARASCSTSSSVVDPEVAKISTYAVQKAVRRAGKKFIAACASKRSEHPGMIKVDD